MDPKEKSKLYEQAFDKMELILNDGSIDLKTAKELSGVSFLVKRADTKINLRYSLRYMRIKDKYYSDRALRHMHSKKAKVEKLFKLQSEKKLIKK